MCLEQGKLVPLTQCTERRKKLKQCLTIIFVYRKYRTAFFESDTDGNSELYMIKCTVCKDWSQKKCERIPNIYFRNHKKVWKRSFCK